MPIDPIPLEFPLLHDPNHPAHRIAGRLEPYLRVIASQFRPLKIILFGSHAYGAPSEDSDLDLLIVRRGFSSEKESNMEIRQALWQVPGARPGFTLLTKSPEYLEERCKRQSPFYLEILSRGLVVYAA